MPKNINTARYWDGVWLKEGLETWRRYPNLYDRIVGLVPEGSKVLDIGGGVGVLGKRLEEERGCQVVVLDISPMAIELAQEQGLEGVVCDVTKDALPDGPFDVVIGTEILEHVDSDNMLLNKAKKVCKEGGWAFFAVPDNCMPPSEVEEHLRTYTETHLGKLVTGVFGQARVEEYPPHLLAIVGEAPEKTLGLGIIAWNEEEYLRRCVESVNPDELVIGIDRKTGDDTEKVARELVNEVGKGEVFLFDFESEEFPEGDFASARNLVLERMTTDWIAMLDGHEWWVDGSVEQVRECIKWMGHKTVLDLMHKRGSGWYYVPRVWKNRMGYVYASATHNFLVGYDSEYRVLMPEVVVVHAWKSDKAKARKKQRGKMNIENLLRDVKKNPNNPRAWFYLGMTHAQNGDYGKAVESWEHGLGAVIGFELEHGYRDSGVVYQLKLNIAKICVKHLGDLKKAWRYCMDAWDDDLSRNEHIVILGDVDLARGQLDRARRWYEMALQYEMPISHMFVDEAFYSYYVYQQLGHIASVQGKHQLALEYWHKLVKSLPAPLYYAQKSGLIAALEEQLGVDKFKEEGGV